MKRANRKKRMSGEGRFARSDDQCPMTPGELDLNLGIGRDGKKLPTEKKRENAKSYSAIYMLFVSLVLCGEKTF